MKFLVPAAALVCLFALSSCATKFTPAQREALSTVAIASTVVNADSYAEPYGGDRVSANNAKMATNNQGGAIGGALSTLLVEGIAATQDKMFRNKNSGYFQAVQNTPPK